MRSRIILIRHGQTDWNIQMRYQGSKDIPLNNTGIAQARLLARRMKNEAVNKVYSSGMKRANEFGKIVFGSVEIEHVPGLREISFGIFEGMTYDEIMKAHPDIYSEWVKDPMNLAVPGGEDLKSFGKRVLTAFNAVADSAGRDECLAIVTHGGAISVIVNSVSGSNSFWENIPETASVTIIESEGGVRRLKSFNDTSHLQSDQPHLRGEV